MRQHSARPLFFAVFLSLILFFAGTPALAQDSTGTTAKPAGILRGLTLNEFFDGSTNSDGQVMQLNSSVGYNFNRHFGFDAGLPLYFVHTAASISQSNPSTVNGTGLGDVYADVRASWWNSIINYDTILVGAAPTGSKDKGFSTGHFTYNWVNEFSHDFHRVSPFVDVGLANSLFTVGVFQRPFISYGHLATFQGGVRVELIKRLTWSVGAYDIAPWGTQTIYSRVVRSSSGPGGGRGSNSFRSQSVTVGNSDLTRDDGFDTWLTFQPLRQFEIFGGYTRSVRLHLNTISFGLGFHFNGLFGRKAGG